MAPFLRALMRAPAAVHVAAGRAIPTPYRKPTRTTLPPPRPLQRPILRVTVSQRHVAQGQGVAASHQARPTAWGAPCLRTTVRATLARAALLWTRSAARACLTPATTRRGWKSGAPVLRRTCRARSALQPGCALGGRRAAASTRHPRLLVSTRPWYLGASHLPAPSPSTQPCQPHGHACLGVSVRLPSR